MRQAQVLSDRDVTRVLAAIAKRSYGHRHRAMFMLSCWLACGWREIAALSVSDAYEADGTVRDHIRLSSKQTKGSEARTVLLNERMQEEIQVVRLTCL